MIQKKSIDPFDEKFFNIPLWCVEISFFPMIFCCKIVNHPNLGPTIWGYSVYQNKPGFRTLGRSLQYWLEDEWTKDRSYLFFDDMNNAIEFLKSYIEPKGL